MTKGDFATLRQGAILHADDDSVALLESNVYYSGGDYRVDVLMTVAHEPVVVQGLTSADLQDYHLTKQYLRIQ